MSQKSDSRYSQTGASNANTVSTSSNTGHKGQVRRSGVYEENLKNIERINSALIATHVDAGEIDKIFNMKMKMEWDSGLDFIRALCALSKDQLSNPNNTKLFALQRIVLVASQNMGEIKLIWA